MDDLKSKAAPRRHTIVCLSSQRWDDGMWTNKQHIMSRLAERHDVYHVNFGPTDVPLEIKRRRRESALWFKPSRLLTPNVKRVGNVLVVDALATSFGLDNSHPLSIRGMFDLRVLMVRRLLRSRGIVDPIIWVYHPGFGAVAGKLPHKLLVYDCVDEYSQFPVYRDDPTWLIRREQELIHAADLVFATSRPLWEIKRKLNPKNTHLVHNVGDAPHFSQALDPATAIPEDITRLPHPIVGFIGAVSDYKLNIDWMLELAKQRPSWSIVLIGPVGLSDPSTDIAKLQVLPNVHLLGHRNYADLPAYIKGFDASVIPYRLNAYTEHVFPIKFFELLATGKPLVVSALPSLSDYFDIVPVANTAAEFVACCDEAIANPAEKAAARIQLASENDWSARVARLMEHIEQKLI